MYAGMIRTGLSKHKWQRVPIVHFKSILAYVSLSCLRMNLLISYMFLQVWCRVQKHRTEKKTLNDWHLIIGFQFHSKADETPIIYIFSHQEFKAAHVFKSVMYPIMPQKQWPWLDQHNDLQIIMLACVKIWKTNFCHSSRSYSRLQHGYTKDP